MPDTVMLQIKNKLDMKLKTAVIRTYSKLSKNILYTFITSH